MKYFLLILLFYMTTCFPAQNYYQFNSPSQEQRFSALTHQLRCLVCQNQNIAESNASLASDLREQIFQRIQRGNSDREIIGYLVDRYGNFILYRPCLNSTTIALWIGPFLILLGSIGYLLRYLLQTKK